MLLALACLACDGATAPRKVNRLYRLATADGRAVPVQFPPTVLRPAYVVEGGQLLLRPDGTFRLHVGGSYQVAAALVGTYQSTGATIAFSARFDFGTSAPFAMRAAVVADSVVFDSLSAPTRLLFRAVIPAAASTSDGTYALTAINDRGPELISFDTTNSFGRTIERVHFDTLKFIDGLFYWRHKKAGAVLYPPRGDSLVSESEWSTFGAVEENAGSIILFDYDRDFSGVPSRDVLGLANGALVRLSNRRGRPVLKESYTRVTR